MERNNLTWVQLTSLKVGGAICLPVIMAGHALCQNFGLESALVAVMIGNAILLLIALTMARMSFKSGMTTTDNAREFFGPVGTRCFAAALIITKTCWIAIQLGLMALSLKVLLPTLIPESIVHIVLGALVIGVAIQGIGALSRLTTLSLPLLVLTMAYALYSTSGLEPVAQSIPFTFEGISLTMATTITAVIDMPTYFRHAKSKWDGMIAAAVFIGVGVPLIEGVGIYLCHQHPGMTVIDTLRHVDSPLWNIWVSVFLMLAGWSTNNSNLYSAVAGLGTLMPNLSDKVRTLLIGAVGIILSLCGILQSFMFVLQLLGVMVASMGCVIFTRYLLNRVYTMTPTPRINLMMWMLGAVVGLSTAGKWVTITGIPLIDACSVAILTTAVSHLIQYLQAKFKLKDRVEV